MLALLEHGADVNAQDEDQDTPLHVAVYNAGEQGAAEVIDSILRSGADETILNGEGKTAMDVAGDEFERVRELLANAPADRTWRRRGYLVLCRAHPDRLQRMQDVFSAPTGTAHRTRRADAIGNNGGAVEGGTAGERVGGGWAVVVVRVLELQEEDIFRTIVGYL